MTVQDFFHLLSVDLVEEDTVPAAGMWSGLGRGESSLYLDRKSFYGEVGWQQMP